MEETRTQCSETNQVCSTSTNDRISEFEFESLETADLYSISKTTVIDHSVNLKGTRYSLVVQLLWDGNIYVAGNGIVSAHDACTYAYIWRNKLKGKGIGAYCSLIPYVNSDSFRTILVGFHGYVISLNAITGEEMWSCTLPGFGRTFVSLCPKSNQLFVG